MGCGEEWGYIIVGKAGDAAANTGNEEGEIRMGLGEQDKLIDIRTNGFYPALHSGDAVTLALQAYALPHDGAELTIGDVSGATAMHACKVATKNKNLVWL